MRKTIRSVVTLAGQILVLLGIGILFTLASGCSSHPIKPEAENVKVTRDEVDKDCKDLGPVEGTVQTKSGNFEQALENMKLDAARKGANTIQMLTTSAYGTTTRGTAYFCP